MLAFLDIVHHSMSASRRKAPTPQDFIAALAAFDISPSSLRPFINIPPAPSITLPALPVAPPSPPPPQNLDSLLGGELSSTADGRNRKYVPSHLPKLPSRHTWQATAVLPTREHDALKIRERATQEGVMAEQALRRLTQASSKTTESRVAFGRGGDIGARPKMAWDHALQTAQQMDAREVEKESPGMELDADDMDMDFPVVGGRTKHLLNTSLESGLAVNYDRRYWRASGRGKT
jgi:transcription initiation factor TFIID subunit 8